jgi:hypothetical protein
MDVEYNEGYFNLYCSSHIIIHIRGDEMGGECSTCGTDGKGIRNK